MIVYLDGKLALKTSTEAIIECNGIGYNVSISVNTSMSLPDIGEKIKLFTLLIFKDDSLQLYGFANDEEREIFKMLITISGIGPKTAMAVLSSLTVIDLQTIILTGDSAQLSKLPNIGKKTAERLVLELKDKIDKVSIRDESIDTTIQLIKQEAISALVALGFNRALADKSVKIALKDFADGKLTAEDLIKKSLKYVMG